MAQGHWHRALAPSSLPPFLQRSLVKSLHSLSLLVRLRLYQLLSPTVVAAVPD